MAIITVIDGPHRKAGSQDVVMQLSQKKGRKYCIIGREGNGPTFLVLQHDEMVSKKHARIYFEGGAYRIEDLKSTNGTKIDREKQAIQVTSQSIILADRDKILVGSTILLFTDSSDEKDIYEKEVRSARIAAGFRGNDSMGAARPKKSKETNSFDDPT